MNLIALMLLAQVSSPIGEGVCVTMQAAFDPRSQVAQSVEGIGGYCSLSGCTLTGQLKMGGTAENSAIVWTPNTRCGLSGSVCMYMSGSVHTTYFAGAVRLTLNNGNGRVGITGGLDVSGDVSATTYVSAGTYVRSTGVAFASLPACNAGLAGAIEYATDVSCMALCNGTAWECLANTGGSTTQIGTGTFMSGFCNISPCTEDTNVFLGPASTRSGSGWQNAAVQTVSCSWGVAGVGAGNVEIQIYNTTLGSEMCTCTLGACTTAINTPMTCSCTFAPSNASDYNYVFRLKGTTGCATSNPGNIFCNAMQVINL